MKSLTVTIGIATSFANSSLIATARSIKLSIGKKPCNCVIYCDTTPCSIDLKRKLQKLGFKIRWFPGKGSFFKKVRRMIRDINTDILILTQDDVIFDPKAIPEIVSLFRNSKSPTMVGVRILPLPPKAQFENAMASMIRIVDRIAGLWNNGNNYLSASGRCLAFDTKFLKHLKIPEIVNGDSYLYLANKRSCGRFIRSDKAKVYIRAPRSFNDQIRPSSRYQYQRMEMEKYFHENLEQMYKIPLGVLFRAIVDECIIHPFATFHYLFIRLLTRLMRKSAKSIMKPVWNPDRSTKNLA